MHGAIQGVLMPPQNGSIEIRFSNGAADNVFDETIDPTKAFVKAQNVRLSPGQDGLIGKAPGVCLKTATATHAACYGIAPHGSRDNAAAYFRPMTGQQRLSGPTSPTETLPMVAPMTSTMVNGNAQNGYFPVLVQDSGVLVRDISYDGALGAVDSAIDPSLCVNQGFMWTAFARPVSGVNHVFVSVMSSAGKLVTATDLGISTSNVPWIQITSHGVNGVRLWVFDTFAGGNLTAYALSMSAGHIVSAGTPVTVAGALACVPDVIGDDTYAFVLARHPSTSTVMRLSRMTVASGAVTSFDLSGWASGSGSKAALAFAVLGGVRTIGLVNRDTSPQYTCLGVANGDAMTLTWSLLNTYNDNPSLVTCAFHAQGTSQYLVVARRTEGKLFDASQARTRFSYYVASTGVVFSSYDLPWMDISRRGVSWNADATNGKTEIYPLFMLARSDYTSVTNRRPVLDPALTLFVGVIYANNTVGMTPIGRFGVDEYQVDGVLAPTYIDTTSTTLTFAYKVGDFYRWCALDMRGRQPGQVTSSGSAIIAAALSATFDGDTTVETGHLHIPYLTNDPAAMSGTGAALTGTYRYMAIYTYKSGDREVRSAPTAVPLTLNLTAQSPRIRVTSPLSMRDGISLAPVACELYSSYWNGSTASQEYYAIAISHTITNGFYEFANILNGNDATYPGTRLLYSDGSSTQELVPAAPPALHDIAYVNDRIVGICAEHRDRLIATKHVSNIFSPVAPEFCPDLEMFFPIISGKLTAARNFGGQFYVLSENAIFTLYQDAGPDNLGNGEWSSPTLVSTYGCAVRESVVVTPVGIMFLTRTGPSTNRYALFSGAGNPRIFSEVVAPQNVLSAVVYMDKCEAVFVEGDPSTGATLIRVYNWREDGWTTWNMLGATATAIAKGDGSPYAWIATLDSAASYLMALDENTAAPGSIVGVSSGQMYHETPWIQPAGTNGDCAFREVWLSAFRKGPHSLTVNLYYDFETTLGYSKTWTDAELTAAGMLKTSGRYTVKLKLDKHEMRSLKIVAQESNSTGLGLLPIAATVYYGATSDANRRSPGSTK